MLLFIAISLFVVYMATLIIQRSRKLAKMPPKYPAWPFLGNPEFTGASFMDWAVSAQRDLGPVYTVEVNGTLAVVLGSREAAVEAFVRQGDAFMDRPSYPLGQMANGGNIGLLLENGDIFREQRRFAMSTLRDLGFGKPLIEQTIQEEVSRLVDDLLALKEAPFDPHASLSNTVANVIARVVLGRRFGKESPQFHTVLENVTRLTRDLTQTRLIAVPEWVQVFLGHLPQVKRAIANTAKYSELQKQEIRSVLKERRSSHPIHTGDRADTYVDAFMQMQQANSGHFFNEEQLVSASSDLFAAGMDTTATTVRWLLLHFVRNPKSQEKAFQSIKSAVGLDRAAGLEDRASLGFLEAAIAESQRISPLVPFSPRRATRDVKIGAWTIPAGTITLANLWAMHRDPLAWEAPEEFRPERFLKADGSLDRAQLDRLAPFGFGKRKCLGESLARAELFLLSARLTQRFRFTAPVGEKLPGLDDYYRGIVLAPFHFKLIATSRY